MAIFVIADLHLSIGDSNKSMEVFGSRWNNYIQKIEKNWRAIVSENDTVIVPGDISWGLTISDAYKDFEWLNALPGKKLLLKGNHDFWWSTSSKINTFFKENEFDTISILNNNSVEIEDYIIAGSRGWFTDKTMQNTSQAIDYDKIINREVIRLEMSLKNAVELKNRVGKEILVFLHFPPGWGDFRCESIIERLKKYEIKRVFFGHIHSCYNVPDTFCSDSITFRMISADFLDFIPRII